MTTTFKWTVSAAPFYENYEGSRKFRKVIYAVFWTVTASDGENEASDNGCIGLDLSLLSSDTFLPYEKLTHEQVADWAKDALGSEAVAKIEAHLDASLAMAHAPTTLPWATETNL
jgi:hypothetical protein